MAAALALATSGCIAAVVPLAAGAALATTQGDAKPRPGDPPPAASASARSDIKLVQTTLTALPPPDAPMGRENPAIATFRSYALSQAAIVPGAGKRASAIVPAASALRAARADCGALPPAVFIDLDPGRGAFDPLSPGRADPALGAALAALRDQGVKVIWFSRLSSGFLDAAREALADGGLDPAGADELVLMADIAERKQSLRDAAARQFCPIAILGDERADFDELYLYLKDPDAAVPLDAMIGRGWFLASPFAPHAESPTGAKP